MSNSSAGLLLCRFRDAEMEFLLVHPGGPFWKNKDAGAWTIPKGQIGAGEEPLAAAKREFLEELGFEASGNFVGLTPIKQKGGKLVRAWAFAGDCDPGQIKSNTFTMEWPPRSGRSASFPEIDQAAFFRLEAAKAKINPAQIPLLEEARQKIRP
jgi:predicted NUDIX family NTP pyrophosphohydrolase